MKHWNMSNIWFNEENIQFLIWHNSITSHPDIVTLTGRQLSDKMQKCRNDNRFPIIYIIDSKTDIVISVDLVTVCLSVCVVVVVGVGVVRSGLRILHYRGLRKPGRPIALTLVGFQWKAAAAVDISPPPPLPSHPMNIISNIVLYRVVLTMSSLISILFDNSL